MREGQPTASRHRTAEGTVARSEVTRLIAELEEHGIARIPEFLTPDRLHSMQRAFEARLRRMRWNDFEGYEQTEWYRHMVQDVLTLDQGFLDAALHPLVTEALREYLGSRFELVEAKGWKSLPTMRDFHGWHGDAWYDQGRVEDIPREVKLGVYLTDVKSGAFTYIRGSHRKQHPRPVRTHEIQGVPRSTIGEVLGPAGSGFLFDTSGIHRQGAPILEPRWAVFYNYHDPDIPLQNEDLEYYRYHPLVLNAAFPGRPQPGGRAHSGIREYAELRPRLRTTRKISGTPNTVPDRLRGDASRR